MEEAFADCGEVLSINWFEEKETKKFMGAGVVEFESSEAAGGGVHSRHAAVMIHARLYSSTCFEGASLAIDI